MLRTYKESSWFWVYWVKTVESREASRLLYMAGMSTLYQGNHELKRTDSDHKVEIRHNTKSDLLVLFTSFWCSVRTLSLTSGGIKTKSMEASSSKTSRRGGFGDPKSSFVWSSEIKDLYNKYFHMHNIN